MQFEEFDKKVREAADHHHPAYDDNAWSGMEKLLNKYMPVEKDNRRRVIFFLLLFLLLGGGGFWLFSGMPGIGNKKQAKTNITTQQKTADISLPGSDKPNKITGEKNSGMNTLVDDKPISIPNVPGSNKDLINTVREKNLPKNIITKAEYQNKITDKDQNLNKSVPAASKIDIDKDGSVPVLQPAEKTDASIFISEQKNKINELDADKNQNSKTSDEKTLNKDLPGNEKELLSNNTPEKKTKTKSKKGNNFFISLSAGPDLSFAGSDKPGKTKLLAGLGMGYTIKDRFTIRSGFYSGRKVYTASPDSYHPPSVFWAYYPYLEKIEADCKVYEIPITMSYNFGQNTKQNWFASAGLSSFLMKKETYNYHYKYNPAGPTVQRKWTIEDENKHYFSVLTLSGGYQKKISNSFTIMAEPYMKLPLSGVGYGKVKLNSGGILISIGYSPFTGAGNKQKTRN
jgi:hypothetical protein